MLKRLSFIFFLIITAFALLKAQNSNEFWEGTLRTEVGDSIHYFPISFSINSVEAEVCQGENKLEVEWVGKTYYAISSFEGIYIKNDKFSFEDTGIIESTRPSSPYFCWLVKSGTFYINEGVMTGELNGISPKGNSITSWAEMKLRTDGDTLMNKTISP